MTELMNAVNIKKAAEGKKESMWTDSEKYPAISDAEGVSAKVGVLRHIDPLLIHFFRH